MRWKKDAGAGVVLGICTVPDGLAAGVLAGVNPLAGLYGALFGLAGAATCTGNPILAVTTTGAMALIIADADLANSPDPGRALSTLAVMTGAIMLVAGALRAGKLMRFISAAVMTGFVTAVGVNIVLGQLSTVTGYDGGGANRVARSFDVVMNLPRWHLPTVAVGITTIAVILAMRRTRFGAVGYVAAVIAGSALTFGYNSVANADAISVLDHLVTVPNGLPAPILPNVADMTYLLWPALSLALVGLVQGAGVTASLQPADKPPGDMSRDFLGQGAGNLLSGLFRGMPVGGSMSATALIATIGARSRIAPFVAAAVMAAIILFAADTVGHIAMPALAGLLIVVGLGAVKPIRVVSVARSSPAAAATMAVTFALTLTIRLQFAVLIGVALTILMFVAHQANRVKVRQIRLDEEGALRESDPPAILPAHTVVVLQVLGSLFSGSAPTLERQLPAVGPSTRGSVVILRLRGIDEIGLSPIEVLRRYATALHAADCTLKVVANEPMVLRQLDGSGLTSELGTRNIYQGSEWIGKALRTAYDDARHEVADGR